MVRIVLFLVGLTACTTTPRQQKMQPREPVTQQEKPGSKTPSVLGDGENKANTDLALWTRVSDKTIPYSTADQALVAKLSTPTPGSVEEAIAVMGRVRETLNDAAAHASTVKEQDLFTGSGQVSTTPIPHEKAPVPQPSGTKPVKKDPASLERTMSDAKINLPEMIERNALLKSYAALSLTQEALVESQNSPSFNQIMMAAIQREAGKWQELSGTKTDPAALPAQPPVPQGGTPLSAGATGEAISAAPSGSPEVSPGDFRRGDSVLMEAQRLADRGSFREAIDRAATIAPNDPFFPSAKEKIKRFSNKAVQQLRQKAAQAFQSAMPVTDSGAKAAYLEQAQKYLKDALANYPEADQLGTVRDNLAVIARNLESVQANPGSRKDTDAEQ